MSRGRILIFLILVPKTSLTHPPSPQTTPTHQLPLPPAAHPHYKPSEPDNPNTDTAAISLDVKASRETRTSSRSA